MLIRGDIVTTVLICGVVFFVTAISSCIPYFLREIPRRKNSLSPRARKSHSEESPNLNVVNTENRPLKLDCSMPDNRRNGGLGSQSLLDAALDPIILGLDRDLEIRI